MNLLLVFVVNSLLSFCLHAKPVHNIQAIQPKATASSELSILRRKAEDLNPHVLQLAVNAYHKAANRGLVHKPYIAVIDYSLPANKKRFWVIDMKHYQVPYATYVAHGKTTGSYWARHFSNSPGSKATSLGVFVTQNTYFGHKGLSMRINGLEKGFNDRALSRAIVVHGAPYVSASHVGRSWGCPALPTNLSKPIINTLKNGSVLFAYYPDKKWLSHSKYIA